MNGIGAIEIIVRVVCTSMTMHPKLLSNETTLSDEMLLCRIEGLLLPLP
jgi:hypothetical protein